MIEQDQYQLDVENEWDNTPEDSDEEADRYRKLQNIQKSPILKEKELLQKLQEMRKHFDATILKKSGAANKKKTSISWIERLDAVSGNEVEILNANINDDIQRELQNSQREQFHSIIQIKIGQKLVRPDDYLVEMFKTDRQMEKVRSGLVRQEIRIKNQEEKRLRKENKKFAKKLQNIKEQEKAKEKKKNLAAIQKWKEEIKRKGDQAVDLDQFMAKEKGPSKRSGAKGPKEIFKRASGKGAPRFSSQAAGKQIPKTKKKLQKKSRPGKVSRQTNKKRIASSKGGKGKRR